MAYVRSVEDEVCTACGALITESDLLDGVVRVMDRTSRPMQFHMPCFELLSADMRRALSSSVRRLYRP